MTDNKYYTSNGFNPEHLEWVTYFDSASPLLMVVWDIVIGLDGLEYRSDVRILKNEDGSDRLSHTGECYEMLDNDGYGYFDGHCQHCGQSIRYCCIFRNTQNGELIVVGETCAENRMELTLVQFEIKREKTRVLQIKSRREHSEKVAEWYSEDSSRVELIDFIKAEELGDDFCNSLLHYFNKEGRLTDGQEEAIIKHRERAEKYAQQKADDDANAVDVPEGKGVQVVGTILTVKYQESHYGNTLKMLVRSDEGYKVWGTVPSAIYEIEKDDRVQFIANLEQSDRDSKFGFFKRPRKAIAI